MHFKINASTALI